MGQGSRETSICTKAIDYQDSRTIRVHDSDYRRIVHSITPRIKRNLSIADPMQRNALTSQLRSKMRRIAAGRQAITPLEIAIDVMKQFIRNVRSEISVRFANNSPLRYSAIRFWIRARWLIESWGAEKDTHL